MDSPLAVSLITLAVTSLIGLLVYSLIARIKQEIRHSIQKSDLRIDVRLEAIAKSIVTRLEFEQYQEDHRKWGDEVIRRLEERINHVERLNALSQENNRLLAQLINYIKQGDRNIFNNQ